MWQILKAPIFLALNSPEFVPNSPSQEGFKRFKKIARSWLKAEEKELKCSKRLERNWKFDSKHVKQLALRCQVLQS